MSEWVRVFFKNNYKGILEKNKTTNNKTNELSNIRMRDERVAWILLEVLLRLTILFADVLSVLSLS